jgi:GST-like protein
MATNDEHVLYGYTGSGSAAVEAALALAKLPCRRVDAASWDAKSELAALKAANPLLQVPALKFPDGSVMTESAAILAELGLRHPASGLLPADATQRAQVLRGLVYIAANCYACIGIIDYPERFSTGGAEGEEREHIITGTRQRLHELWSTFADSFAASPWLSGAELGALDLLAVVVSKWSGARQHLLKARPEFSALLKRIEAHPSVAGVLASHFPSTG